MQQIKKRIGFAVLLLFLTVAMLSLLTVHADAPAGYHEITVRIDGGDSTCTITLTGADILEDKYCKDGLAITVTAIAGDGYEFDRMEKIVNGKVSSIDPGKNVANETAVTEDMTFVAYFKAKTYKLVYNANEKDASIYTSPSLPSTYTYGEDAFELYIPDDTPAYTFVGWYEGENAIKKSDDGKYWYKPSTVPAGSEIHLIAKFEPREIGGYRVDMDWLTKKRISTEDTFYAGWKYRDKITADENLTDPDGSLREYPGYTFITGDKKYYTEITVSATQKLNEVVRYYVPNTYRVTFDACGGTLTDADGGAIDVTYNQKISDIAAGKLPTREGYTFAGYYSERDGRGTRFIDGAGVGGTWNIAENTTLYAYWVAKDYQISFDAALTDHASVTIRQGTNSYPYDGTPLSFTFGTTLTVTITAKDGYKLVSLDGENLNHTKSFTFNLTVGAADQEVTGVVLPVCSVPDFRVDYLNEKLTVDGGIPAGSYVLRAGNTEIPFTGSGETPALSGWFGSTVQILCRGDGTTTADSEWVDLALAARPAKPTMEDSEGNGTVKRPGIGENDVTLTVTDGDTLAYEFAYAKNIGDKLVWQDSGVFTGLNAGTTYTFHIRIKATETAPHGEELSVSVYTLNEKFLQGVIENLRANGGSGDNVTALIERYVTLMQALKPGSDYEEEIERLQRECLAKLDFARYQDQMIAEINADCEKLLNGSLYNDAGKETLRGIRDDAIVEINGAATEQGVDNARKSYDAKVAEIPVRIDLTELLISLGVVILLQVIALIILLARRAKYADYVKYHRGSAAYGMMLPAAALFSAEFLPERQTLIAVLLGVIALVLQTVIMVLIFRTAAIARNSGKQDPASQDPGKANPTPPPQEPTADSRDAGDSSYAFAPQMSVFRDDDAPGFESDGSSDGLQEEDWYDGSGVDDTDEEPVLHSFEPDEDDRSGS